MATRNRSTLFIQYRNSFGRPKRNTELLRDTEKVGLIGGNGKKDFVIDVPQLPPKWVDILEQFETTLNSIKEKISALENVYKRHALPGFQDKDEDEASIEQLSAFITRSLQDCQKKIKIVEKTPLNSDSEAKMCKNVQISMATQLSDLSKQFRTIQSNYIQKLKNRQNRNKNMFDFEQQSPEFVNVKGHQQAQFDHIQENEEKIRKREEEINEIAKSIFSLAEIFKDLQTLVIDQGTVLDRIDYNIEMTVTHMKSATVELEKGTEYQKKAGKKLVILLLLVIVFAMIIAVIFKPR